MKTPPMKDMSIDKEAPESMGVPVALGEYQNKYPYGLAISLDHSSLEKLGLDDNCEVGDMIHLFALAKVTGKNAHDTGEGEKRCVNLQICFLGLEDEESENEEADKEEKPKGKKKRSLYF